MYERAPRLIAADNLLRSSLSQYDPIHRHETVFRQWAMLDLANRGIMPSSIMSGFF
jgi:hypothetical protein